jgi:hypothetical protein
MRSYRESMTAKDIDEPAIETCCFGLIPTRRKTKKASQPNAYFPTFEEQQETFENERESTKMFNLHQSKTQTPEMSKQNTLNRHNS